MRTWFLRRYDLGALAVVSCILSVGACVGHSSTGVSANGDAGTLVLQAYGGPSGKVGADVPLLEPGVGQQKTCADPLVAAACQLTSCLLGGIGSPSWGYGDFGPILVSVGTTTMPLTYNGAGYGTIYFPAAVMLGTGGTMRFRGGNGLTVPAFDISATIPGLAVMTSPVAPTTTDGATIIDTSQDLPVRWSAISIGTVSFALHGGNWDVGGTAISVVCTFDGASGAGAVPQALLASLKEMSGTNPVWAGIGAGLEATTVVDRLSIVTQSSQAPATTYHDFNVTLQ